MENLINENIFNSFITTSFVNAEELIEMGENEEQHTVDWECPINKEDVKKFFEKITEYVCEKHSVNKNDLIFDNMNEYPYTYSELMDAIDEYEAEEWFSYIFDRILRYDTIYLK